MIGEEVLAIRLAEQGDITFIENGDSILESDFCVVNEDFRIGRATSEVAVPSF